MSHQYTPHCSPCMPTYSRAYRAIHCLKAFLYRPQIDIYTFFSTLPTKQPRKIVTAFYRMTIFIGKVVSKLDLHLFRILPSFWKSALTTPTAPREQSGRHRSKKKSAETWHIDRGQFGDENAPFRVVLFGFLVEIWQKWEMRILPSFWKSALTTPTAPREQSGRHRSKKKSAETWHIDRGQFGDENAPFRVVLFGFLVEIWLVKNEKKED